MCTPHLLTLRPPGSGCYQNPEMVQVTLDQIQPFTHNPRIIRNPGYDALKASIRARGLDTTPLLTRSPYDQKYMIASGGNTRLTILNELWRETSDERFYRFHWPFRPWPEGASQQQGDLQCLIGHMAESDLHSGLMFIERAQGILRLWELYHEAGVNCMTQQALAEQLTNDGYPISQPQISRMIQTVDWLLPSIPDALYSGLTRTIIDPLLALRRTANQVWEKLISRGRHPEFVELFSTALSVFNGEQDGVIPHLVQDELLGEMSRRSGISWNTLLLELLDAQSKRIALLGRPAEKVLWPPPPEKPQKEPALPATHNSNKSNQPDDPELTPLVQTARAICAGWKMDRYIQPDESSPAGFTLSPCGSFPHPAAQRCYQVLAALNGEVNTPMPALELMLSPDYNDEQIKQMMQLITLCRQRRLQEMQYDSFG